LRPWGGPDRKDVLQILGCNVTAGVWPEIPENALVEVAVVDVELMRSPTIFSVVIIDLKSIQID
jgi:hypothetical protein